jgi:hypothetical protein
MRDERGRYQQTKALEEMAPEWAHGCDKCTCGVVSSPPLTKAVNLYAERLVQMIDKQLILCDCRAGQRYYNNLRNLYRMRFEEEGRKPPVELEIARQHIERALLAAQPPNIHMQEERVAA